MITKNKNTNTSLELITQMKYYNPLSLSITFFIFFLKSGSTRSKGSYKHRKILLTCLVLCPPVSDIALILHGLVHYPSSAQVRRLVAEVLNLTYVHSQLHAPSVSVMRLRVEQ